MVRVGPLLELHDVVRAAAEELEEIVLPPHDVTRERPELVELEEREPEHSTLLEPPAERGELERHVPILSVTSAASPSLWSSAAMLSYEIHA